ncbi:MAG: DUF4445 domain-containing protein, partial [bacterium]
LRETLRREGVYVDGTCADNGTCGRCVVRIVHGDAGEPSLPETALLGERSADHDHRLACRVKVKGDLEISVAPERMLEVDRTGRWKEVWGSPLWRPDSIAPDHEGFGLAIDLGTTSVVCGLFDLAGARPLDLKAVANPHLPWGEEIISRLGAVREDPGLSFKLRDLMWKTAGDQVRSLCLRNGLSMGRITRVVAVGNSAVHHLALGLPVESLLTPPYAPSVASAVTLPASELFTGLRFSREAQVYFPPLAGGFAGSDALLSLLAARRVSRERGALIDVGTNTEIALWSGDEVAVGTAPSGPAFEGGHIRSGMRAEEGAIWSAELTKEDLVVQVLGGGTAKGICGTGIVDLVAAMVRAGVVDRSGLILEGSHPLVSGGRLRIGGGGGIALDGEDVATVQKAKAAVAGTLHMLLKGTGMALGEIGRVYLGGAFGSRLNLSNAVRIGLLPDIPLEDYVLAGNTALVGASMVLVSEEARLEAERMAPSVRHIGVADTGEFEELFIDNLYFS